MRVMGSRTIFPAAMLAAILASCGPSPTSVPSVAVPSSPQSVASGGDWEFERMFNDPLPPGEEKTSIADAQQDIPFHILTPSLGEPLRVRIDKVTNQGKDGAAVAIVYDTSSYGRIVIMETLDPVDMPTEEAWEQEAADAASSSGKAGRYGTSERVSVRGALGLLGEHPTGRIGLAFFEDGILVRIFGPDLSKDQVVAIAESMN